MKRKDGFRWAPAALATVTVAVLLFLLPAALYAATYYVGTTTDENDGGDCTNSGNSDCSLRDAVAAATANAGDDTVQVPAGTYVLSLGQISSNNGILNVVGAGAASTTISGNDASRILEAGWSSAGFTFTDITLTHGNAGAAADGGCVRFTNKNISITDSVFSYCQARRGGALYSDQAITVTVSGSTFDHNTAANDASQGGGAISAKEVTVTNSTFSNNTATGASARGGAIYSPTTVSVTGSTFTNNQLTTGGSGGAIFALNTTIIDTSAFSGNSNASGGGGAVHINAGSGMITDSSFSSNTATGDGGAVYSNADVTISQSTFDGNSTSGGTGGALTRYGNVNVTNSTFSGNSSSHHGGAIRGGSTTTIKYSTFYNNSTSSVGTGGAFYADNANVEGTIFTANTANAVADNCAGPVTSAGYNIDYGSTCGFAFTTGDQDADPALQALADNGGPTQTLAILATSPAVDAGPATCSASPVNGVDQRGEIRPGGSNCDTGAFEYVSGGGNTAPVGGYTADNVIPSAQITQSTDGDGIITIQFRAKDAETENVTLKTFEYSVDGGSTWNAPANGDASVSLSANWTDSDGGGTGYTSATDWSGTVHSFTFDTDHADVSGMADVDQSDIQVRFTLNDATDDSAAPVTSESFQVDNVAPTDTITSAEYNSASDTLTVTGTDFDTIAATSTDIKSYVDWTKFVWDINGDGAATADITFDVSDITSATVTDATTLTIVLSAAKGASVEGTADYASSGGNDTLDVTAGFSKDAAGNTATSDGVADAALSVPAPSFTVTKTADTNDGSCDVNDCSLREAITAANADPDANTITIPAGTYTITLSGSDDTNATGDFDITNPVNIVGAGSGSTIIDAASGDRVFHITNSSAVTIEAVTVRFGTIGADGGCIYAADDITIRDSIIDSCTSTANLKFGGAIYSGGALTMENSTVSNGTANHYGGGISSQGGTLTNVTFTNNHVVYAHGGAIYNATNLLTINGSANTFTGNYAPTSSTDYGGSIYSTGSLSISNTAFSGRNDGTADAGRGGAIYLEDDANVLTLSDSSFANLLATNSGGAIHMHGGAMSNVTFTDNQAQLSSGGAIENLANLLTIAGTNTFDGNRAGVGSNDYGGSIYSSGSLTISNTAFVGRSDGTVDAGRGGAICLLDTTDVLTLSDSSFASFISAYSGGAIRMYGGTMSNVTFTNNQAQLSTGGAIENFTNSLTIAGTNIFTNNDAGTGTGDNGGAIYTTGSLELSDATVSGNSAYEGGAICIGNGVALTITDSSFDANQALRVGGAIRSGTGGATISSSTFSSNSTTNPALAQDGGAIYSTGILNLTNSTFFANTVGDDGGAIYQAADATIKNSTFYNNIAGGSGEAICRSAGTVTLENTIVAKSTASASLCTGVTSNDYNLQYNGTCFTAAANDVSGQDPQLVALADNGGPTQTHALPSSSPAVDKGNNTTCAAAPVSNLDQRGTTRPVNGGSSLTCDIGAYEYDAGPPANYAPVGGYTADNVIPAAQVTQSTDGDGIITIQFRAKDADTDNVTLKTFEYSVDGGSTWNAPTNGDGSASLSANWTDSDGGGTGYTTAIDWSGTVHSFTFDTDHNDVSGMAGVDQSDVQVRFTLNDSTDDSAAPATSESFQVDDLAPTDTITSAEYNSATDTLVVTGTNFTTIADVDTDIKGYVDWSKFVWDINADGATTTDITFAESDVTNLTVTDDSTLTLVLTVDKGTAVEATTGYGADGGADSLDVTAGFSKDAVGNAATTDAVADGALTVASLSMTVCSSDADFTTIQDAIDAVTDGYTILVCDGTYSENIDFSGKDITVQSENGAAVTIIQGDGSNAPVVTFANAETGSAVLDGFTINNQAAANSLTRGVAISGSAAPTLSNLIIKDNLVTNSYVLGGGIYINGGSATIDTCTIGDATLPNNAAKGSGVYAEALSAPLSIIGGFISNNTGGSNSQGVGIYLKNNGTQVTTITGTELSNNVSAQYGAAIYLNASKVSISGATFENNSTTNTGMQGGAIFSTGTASSITLVDTDFTGNTTTGSGGTIYISGSTEATPLSITGGTFTGSGGTDAGNAGGAIYLDSMANESIIDGVTLTGLLSTNGGSAVYTKGALTIQGGSVIEDCGGTGTTGDGGAIRINGASVTIDNTSISSSKAKSGGAFFVENSGVLTVQNGSEISGNTATNTVGGGIYVPSGTVTVSGSLIRGNKSQQHGGGIYMTASATVTLTNSTVTGNAAGVSTWEKGGGIANGGAGPNLAGGTLYLYNCTIAGNYAAKSGGGLYANGTETVHNSIFWGNQANSVTDNVTGTLETVEYSDIGDAGYPAGTNINGDPLFIDLQQASLATPTPLGALGDVHLSAGSAAIDVGGGPAELDPDPPTVDIDGDSRAQGSGYDMGSDEYAAVAVNSTTVGTATASVASATSIDVSMPYSDDEDGDNTYTVDYKLSSSGSWTNHVTEAAHAASPYTTTITGLATGFSYDVRVTYVDADGVTGDNPQIIEGVVPAGATRTVCSVDADFTTIQAAIDAATDGDTVQVCDGTYNENIDFAGKDITVQSVNGAASTFVKGTTSENNNPVVTFVSGETSSAVLDGFTIDNNTENASNTRGITITDSASTIKNCIIENNQAYYATPGYGGGIKTTGTGGATIIDTIVRNNTTGTSGERGGGIYHSGSGLLSITGGSVESNFAYKGGGGIVGTSGDITLDGVTVKLNSSGTGAVVGGGGIHYSGGGTLTVQNGSSIESNTASKGGGGGIYLSASTLNITGSTIKSNTNSGVYGGGGINVEGASTVTISKSNILGNRANGTNNDSDAGGIKISAGTATITNTVIAGNTADNAYWAEGGGIYNAGTLNLYFSTVSDNYSDNQGGIYGGGTENIYNSIVWGNSASVGDAEISGTAENLYLTETTNDPTFMSRAAASDGNPTTTGDYHLQADSICIDAGDATNAPADDIEGDERPVDIADMGDGVDDYDMGSDEFTSGGPSQPPDHYAISHSGIGITCEAEQIIITAHDASDTALNVPSDTGITITTSSGKGDWYLVSGTGTLANGSSDDGAASYTLPVGENNVVLALSHTTTGSIDIDVSDGTATDPDDAGSEDPQLVFSDAAFRFYADDVNNAISTQIGGKSSNLAPGNQTLTLRAIKTDTDTGACVARVGSQTLSINMAYECLDPATCSSGKLVGIASGTSSMTCPSGIPSGGTAISGNPSGSVASYDGVSLAFDATGTATFTLVACDVGQLRLHATKALAASGNDPATTLTGASNDFVSRPLGFALSAAGNPGASGPSGTIYKKAGADFSVTATAVLWEAGDDGDNDGTPDGHADTDPSNHADLTNNPAAKNFGQESTAEEVLLSAVLDQPAGGTDPGLSVPESGSNIITSFANGSGSSTVQYNEVGIIEMAATVSDGDFLGSGSAASSKSGYVGRFIPDHFQVTPNSPDFAAGCVAGSFTYMGQTFGFGTAPVYTVTAVNGVGSTTTNYGGDGTGADFWKFAAPSIDSGYYADQVAGSATFTVDTPGSTVLAAADDYDGDGTLTVGSAVLAYARPTAPIAPFAAAVDLTLAAADLTDTDGVCYDVEPTDGTCDAYSIAGVGGPDLYWGRLLLANGFGSELEDMSMSLTVQYFNGATFVTNTDDTCSEVTVAFVGGSYTDNLTSGETCVQDSGSPGNSGIGCVAAGPVAEQFAEPPLVGDFNLYLQAPGTTNYGSVDLSVTVDEWLRYDWDDDTGTADTGPTATATFGVYRGNDRIINWQEIYR